MEHSDVDVRTWYANDADVYAISGVARLPTNIPDGSYAVYMVIAVSKPRAFFTLICSKRHLKSLSSTLFAPRMPMET